MNYKVLNHKNSLRGYSNIFHKLNINLNQPAHFFRNITNFLFNDTPYIRNDNCRLNDYNYKSNVDLNLIRNTRTFL